ncbi:SDR family oxidoreductase [Pelagibius sp. CAU 1746]|uniref:SDR family oxidoreductase n=1 Tax=Pelagibius sp. CAU 1746 TaxID=3140370 RepID=UPI00325B19A0
MTRILITGCSSGLGRAAALRLSQDGHSVTATVRRTEDAARLRAEAGGRLSVLLMDVTETPSVTDGVRTLTAEGGLPDVLINNAGGPCLGSMEELDIDDLKAAFDLNVAGILRLYQAVAPGMRQRGHGQIINVGSALGAAALPVYGGYCATKFAVEAMSEAMRYELAPFGVTVNLLQPGLIDTPFSGKKDAQRRLRVPETSPYAERLDRPAPAGLAQSISSPDNVSDTLRRMIAAPRERFRWTCGEDSANWLLARRLLDDAAFEAYATHLGYGAAPPES